MASRAAHAPRTAFSLVAALILALLLSFAPAAAQARQLADPLPSPLEALADPDTPTFDAPATQLVDDETQLATSNGVAFELSAQAARYERSAKGDPRELWVLDYADGGRLVAMTDASPWSGFEADLLAFADSGIEALAAEQPGAKLTPATSAVSDHGVAYVSAGLATRDLLVIVAAVPLPTGNAAVLALMYEGVATSEATAHMAAALNSIQLAPVAYYQVVDLLGLDSATVVQTLEDAGFVYAERDGLCGWTAQTQGAAGVDDCLVQLVAFDAEQDGGNAFLSREAALDGAKLGGLQVEWVGTAVEWDEATDVDALFMDACSLDGLLGSGYVYGWDENGAYVYTCVGTAQVRLEEAYWLVTLQMDPATGYHSTTLSADLLRTGFGGFDSYDELLETALEPW